MVKMVYSYKKHRILSLHSEHFSPPKNNSNKSQKNSKKWDGIPNKVGMTSQYFYGLNPVETGLGANNECVNS